MFRLPLAACAVLVAVTGCAVPSTVERDLARAQQADSLGHTRTAYRLLRSAAHGGSLEAQWELASSWHGRGGLSGLALLASPLPDENERRMWAHTMQATAQRLADADDPDGHVALGMLAYYGPDMSHGTGDEVTVAAYADARRHYEAAAELGSRRAAREIAMVVWLQEGLLASEPYFRKSYDAGNRDSAGMLAWITMERPALDRGLRSAGDLSLLDVVGEVRFLKTVGDPESAAAAERRIRTFREQAQAGNADADSLLRAIDAAGLLGSRS